MSSMNYLHKRDIPGVVCSYTEQWQGRKLSGLYLLKCELAEKIEDDGRPPLFLFPGGFDPKDGDFSETTISELLHEARLPAVYEAHFLYEGECGFANVQAIYEDIKYILSSEGVAPLVVGLSGTSMLLADALYVLSQREEAANVSGAFLIGTNLPTFFNLFGRLMMTKFGGARMERRVAKHCGHPFVFDNSEAAEQWWKNNSELNPVLQNLDAGQYSKTFPVPVELHYFRVDTMNRRGREKMSALFSCPEMEKPIPGSHRGLTEIKEVDELLVEFAKKYS